MNGLIALVGSGEYLPVMNEIDRHLLASLDTDGRSPRVVCLPTAAGLEGQPSIARWSRMGIEHFQKLGAQVSAPAIIDRTSAADPHWQPLLAQADLVFTRPCRAAVPGMLLVKPGSGAQSTRVAQQGR
jgi:cyanophycinase